jgi:hypothetical protein
MSPPIRDGSGDSIGSIRLGDGSEIAEVRTGAGDVVFSANAIPASGLSHDYDATQEATGSLSTWTDQAGTADLSSGVAPSVVGTAFGSNSKAVRFDNTDDLLQAATPSDWTFLSDGSAFSFYIVVECRNSGGFRTLASTMSKGSISSTFRGLTIIREDRAGEQALRVGVSTGSSSVFSRTINSSFPLDSPEVYCVAFDGTDQYQIQRGKSVIASPTATGHSSGDPDEALRVGQNSLDPLGGDVGRKLIYQTFHGSQTRDSTVQALADQFGITL